MAFSGTFDLENVNFDLLCKNCPYFQLKRQYAIVGGFDPSEVLSEALFPCYTEIEFEAFIWTVQILAGQQVAECKYDFPAIFKAVDYFGGINILELVLKGFPNPYTILDLMMYVLNSQGEKSPYVSSIVKHLEKTLDIKPQVTLEKIKSKSYPKEPKFAKLHLKITIRNHVRKIEHFWSVQKKYCNSEIIYCHLCNKPIDQRGPTFGDFCKYQFTKCCFRLVHKKCWTNFLTIKRPECSICEAPFEANGSFDIDVDNLEYVMRRRRFRDARNIKPCDHIRPHNDHSENNPLCANNWYETYTERDYGGPYRPSIYFHQRGVIFHPLPPRVNNTNQEE